MKRKSSRTKIPIKRDDVSSTDGWEVSGSLLIKNYGATAQEKVIAMDMDGTLINTKSGKTFATSKDDWVLFTPKVKDILTDYHKKDYLIAILSNQNGISKGKAKSSDILHKVTAIQASLAIPLIFICAIDDDINRKPSTGMWKYLSSYFKDKPDPKKSIYVGDAAGRSKNPSTGKKDFSDGDIKFAKNAGLEFKTPEEFFLGSTVSVVVDDSLSKIPTDGSVFSDKSSSITSDKQEVVLFVGSPGSGKSTFWGNYMKSYHRVNRDTLKTPVKCLASLKEGLESKKSCVIDNTNRDPETRKPFIDMAKSYGVQVRCFVFDMEKKFALHLDNQRNINTNREHLSKRVGKMPINIYYAQYKAPTISEGFTEIKKVQFVAKFVNEKDKECFNQAS